MSNEHLHKARKVRNDEFYSRYEDIEKELSHYQDQLEGLWVYSPCSDYRWSNFTKYFKDNFKKLNLKHYTSTCYDIGDGAWRYDYDGEYIKGHRPILNDKQMYSRVTDKTSANFKKIANI